MIATLLLTCNTDAILVDGSEWMVYSYYTEATKAGALMLQQGGNAFDAVVAVLAALGAADLDPLRY